MVPLRALWVSLLLLLTTHAASAEERSRIAAPSTPRITAQRVHREIVETITGNVTKPHASPKEMVYVYRGLHGQGSYEINRLFQENQPGEYVGGLGQARDLYGGHEPGDHGIVVRFRMPKELLTLGPRGHLYLSPQHLRSFGVTDLRPYVDSVARVSHVPTEAPRHVKIGRWLKFDGRSTHIPLARQRAPLARTGSNAP